MNATTYGLDVAKRVFQMYWVDALTGEIANRRFGRDDLIPDGHFKFPHLWSRKLLHLEAGQR
ncbi:transposase [Caballeronia udeis]|uniref:Transposase n=1 Tax=Caballeronia udeis TaxID=1232866 RepID=A0A158JGF1_9BURK|nr:transposase [Caballeronia udeis]